MRSIAVLDLGSNSFHMLIAQARNGSLRLVDKLREPLRLADGLDQKGDLSESAQARAIACLERFGQRIRALPHPSVRVVGTNTLRSARNGLAFRDRAQAVLGHPIEIISGEEEARLIYEGVAFDREDPGRPRLVVDIGGGSTETIVGVDHEVRRSHSLFMGCVTFTRLFFPDGKISEEGYRAARTAAELEVRGVRSRLLEETWEVSLGASGTCNAIGQILDANEWTDGEITRGGLKKLRKSLIDAGQADRLDLPGLREDRIPVIAGGTAILEGVFRSLEIDRMAPVSGALREGLLSDLIGRIRHADIRETTVSRLVESYHIDQAQASRVQGTALAFADQLGLADDESFHPVRFLDWGAQLHEIGLSVSYTGYHKHGAYILEHSNLPGFSRDDQELLACLIRNHRRSPSVEPMRQLGTPHRKYAPILTALLRLSVVVNRGRNPGASPILRRDGKKTLRIDFPDQWLDKHPLTQADLADEQRKLDDIGFRLQVGG